MTSSARLLVAYCLWCIAGLAQQGSPAPSRRALLLVNGDYQKLTKLEPVYGDAGILAEALGKTGFEVTRIDNGAKPLAEALDDFLASKTKPGDAVVFVFSGYAVQYEERDYLLPTNFDPASHDYLSTRALALTRVQQALERRKVSPKVILIDAAREEKKLAATFPDPGLVRPDLDASTGTVFFFSAALNQTVVNPPPGSGGVLARVFSQLIQKPISLADLPHEVEGAVQAESKSLAYALAQPTDRFYFTAPPVVKQVDPLTQVAQVNRTDRQEYKFIPKGKFQMGCVPSTRKQDQCQKQEEPRHAVTLTEDFWMGVTDVTIDAYDRFLKMSRSRKKLPVPFWKPTSDHPVVNISWEDASAFCKWAGGKLPTEAQWEYAARAGRADEVYPFNNENSRDNANFLKTSGNDIYEYTSPVKHFEGNPWGLYDMSGNVWQWTADWFGNYAGAEQSDPKGPVSGPGHVIRGGSFMSDPAKHLRISYREQAAGYSDKVGFRCVLADGPETRQRFTVR